MHLLYFYNYESAVNEQHRRGRYPYGEPLTTSWPSTALEQYPAAPVSSQAVSSI